MKELNKVITHKSFRIALVALLAVIMVTAFVVERTNLTRAGDEAAEPVAESTLVEEAPAAEPEAAPEEEAAPAPEPDPAPVEEEAAPVEEEEAPAEEPAEESTEEPAEEPAKEDAAPEVTPEPVEEADAAAPVATETAEATEEPGADAEEEVGYANAEEDKDFRTGYATTLGSIAVYNDRKETHEFANLPEGAVVRVTKRVEKERDGEVVETWMGVRFMAEENDEGDLVNVEGYVPAWSLAQLDEAAYLDRMALYERSLEETEEEILAEEEAEDIGDPIETYEGIPVVRVRYMPVPVAEKEEEVAEEVEEKPAPRVEVSFEHEGDLAVGTMVTLHADLINMPEDRSVELQWKNDATGEFEAVSGATGDSFAFRVDADNIDWKWVMEVRIGSEA